MSTASEESWEELAKRQLEEFTVTTQKYRAENQQLREALERIEHVRYSVIGDAESDLQVVKEIAREALAGDTP